MSDFDYHNNIFKNKDSLDLLKKVLDSLSFLDDWTTTEFEIPKDTEFIKAFRNRMCSMVILLRPGVCERATRAPLNFQYTGDDFIIIEYDNVVNEVVQAKLVKLSPKLINLVDNNDGFVIIEE